MKHTKEFQSLVTKIKLTNNGYIFTPDKQELIRMVKNLGNGTFNTRISLY